MSVCNWVREAARGEKARMRGARQRLIKMEGKGMRARSFRKPRKAGMIGKH